MRTLDHMSLLSPLNRSEVHMEGARFLRVDSVTHRVRVAALVETFKMT